MEEGPASRFCRSSLAILVLLALAGCARTSPPDGLARVQSAGKLVFGTDAEGGGPYAYPDPNSPGSTTGFEV